MKRFWHLFISATLALTLIGISNIAYGQFGKLKDKVKGKVEDKADQKVDEKIDETIDKASGDSQEAEEKPADQSQEAKEQQAPGAEAKASKGTTSAEDMSLYTKFDFVPGDKVLFDDDFSSDELGEFPHRWNLDNGVFEVGKKGQDFVVISTQDFLGTIRPKIPDHPLPPKYTVEYDIYGNNSGDYNQWYHFFWVDTAGDNIAEFRSNLYGSTNLKINEKDIANKELAPSFMAEGLHSIKIMATANSIKIYYDKERVANVPKTDDFAPVGFRIGASIMSSESPGIFSSFRYAEGGKTLKEQLDEDGKIVTHGILFDSGSDKIKGESYKTLADIGQLLTENPALRLSIEGHTDSDGADDANLKLSQNRANSVKSYLADSYKIDGSRLETKGWGESKPIDVNNTPEGKANNRRVELVKL